MVKALKVIAIEMEEELVKEASTAALKEKAQQVMDACKDDVLWTQIVEVSLSFYSILPGWLAVWMAGCLLASPLVCPPS